MKTILYALLLLIAASVSADQQEFVDELVEYNHSLPDLIKEKKELIRDYKRARIVRERSNKAYDVVDGRPVWYAFYKNGERRDIREYKKANIEHQESKVASLKRELRERDRGGVGSPQLIFDRQYKNSGLSVGLIGEDRSPGWGIKITQILGEKEAFVDFCGEEAVLKGRDFSKHVDGDRLGTNHYYHVAGTTTRELARGGTVTIFEIHEYDRDTIDRLVRERLDEE